MNVVRGIYDRELGVRDDLAFDNLLYERLCGLALSKTKWIECEKGENETPSAILWLALEQSTYGRMLAARQDAAIVLYDTHVPSRYDDGRSIHTPIATIHRSHRFLVSCVEWYPIDNGIFISGSFDEHVKVWDTDRLQVAWEWEIGSRVSSVAVSPLGTHCLICIGSEDAAVRICDMDSGACTHTLHGHPRAALRSVWSRKHEFQLFSGCRDGQLRLWDIRQSGCLHVFNLHQSTEEVALRKGSTEGAVHRGMITDLVQSPDGRLLISAGTDDCLIVWDTLHLTRLFVQFPNAFNRSIRIRQLSMSEDGRLLFFPSGSALHVYDVKSGDLKCVLRGHMSTVHCCCYNAALRELYSGAGDPHIGVWEIQESQKETDEDSWSS